MGQMKDVVAVVAFLRTPLGRAAQGTWRGLLNKLLRILDSREGTDKHPKKVLQALSKCSSLVT